MTAIDIVIICIGSIAVMLLAADIRIRRQTRRRMHSGDGRIVALQKITSTISEARTFESIIDAIMQITTNALRAELGSVMLYNEDRKGLVIAASRGIPDSLKNDMVIDSEDQISWWVFSNREPLLISDISREKRFAFNKNPLYRGNSLMCVPIVTNEAILGVFSVTNQIEGKAFTQENLETMISIAGHVAIIVGNELNHQKLLKRMDELESLYSLSEQVSRSLDLSKTLQDITKLAMTITHTDACSLRLLNPDSGELDICACTGVGPEYKNKGSLRIGQGVGGYVAQEGIPVTIPNLRDDRRIQYTSYLESEGLMSLVSVPIKDEEESVIGIISVYRREEYNFPEATVSLLSTFANNTAVAIKNARLFETITKNYSDTIQSLALALEAKDKYTRGHSERVTDFAVQIASEMGLSDNKIGTLRFAGRLHDIGKIAISDNILLKKDRLTLSEYADIKTHPQKGADLLKPLTFLEETCSVIKYHHERFDGKGYPDGLSGDRIPLLSRILSVADAFDAMTSERPYRAPLSQATALKETIACAGTQFDPGIVDVFERIITREYG